MSQNHPIRGILKQDQKNSFLQLDDVCEDAMLQLTGS